MTIISLFNIMDLWWILLLILPFIGYICWRNPYEYNTFEECVDSIGGNEATIMIPNEQTITDHMTIPANIMLRFIQGGTFNIAAGKIVTINSHIDAGLYQIFEGEGSVVFGAGTIIEVYPQWWGAKGDGVTDDSAAIQSAINSILISGGVVCFPSGAYEIETTIDLCNINPNIATIPIKTIILRGSGAGTTRFLGGEIGYGFFEFIGSNWLTFEGFSIYANRLVSFPAYAFSGGRKTGDASSGEHIFNDVQIYGNYAKTAFFTLSGEINNFKDLRITIEAGNGLILAKNNLQWTVPTKYEPFGAGVGGNGRNSLHNVRIYHTGNFPGEFLFVAEYAQTLDVNGLYTYSRYITHQISIGKACQAIAFKNLQTEYAIGFTEPWAVIFQGIQDADIADYRDITFEGSRMFGIYGAAGSKITAMKFSNSHWRGTKTPIVDVDTIYDSVFDYSKNLANVTTIHNPVYQARTLEDNIIWTGHRKGAAPPQEVSYVSEYQIDSTPTPGDRVGEICTNRQDTTIRIQANAGVVIMEVTATAGMLAGDVIGITLDNYPDYGSVHWTTISSITDADTLVIAAGIPGGRNAPVNAPVYAMRWKDFGNIELGGSLVWDPANLVDGAGETSGPITVTGAALGDAVIVYPPYDMQDCLVYGYVQAANTVEIRIQNESTGARDFGSATWYVKVLKY